MDKHIIYRRIWLRAPLAALTLILILLAALAGGARAGEFPHDRKGLVLGFNLGGGSAKLEYERLGVKVESEVENMFGGIGRIGFGVSDHVVFSLEGHGFGKTNAEADVQGVMTLVTVTWHPGGGGFFLRGGVGGGAANVKLIGPPSPVNWSEREAEGAGGLGLGYEWRPGYRETVLGSGIFSLQLNWYL